jgi:ribosomal protein S18 acetylase RimI-like enzyme
MPDGVFRTLYDIWIRRSCRGEIATGVIEARSNDEGLDGMVTVAVEGEVGSIGLIAVHARARGRGLGRALVREAERLMRSRGARKATVVTQGANGGACRLYEACGYGVIAASSVHHFWVFEGRA